MSQNRLFPPSYAPWLNTRFPDFLVETQATCDDCAMVRPTGLTRHPGPFKNELKCCTYFPFVPNFSIGGMILEKNTGIDLRLQLARTQGLLLPLGLFPTPERKTLMEENSLVGFGQKPELLCPFFNSQTLGCTAWKQRPGVCTTYFCKSDQGEAGFKFWHRVEEYLNHFEWTLSQEIFSRLGLGENEMNMCEAIMTTEEGDDERGYFFQAAWGHWFEKQNDFFIEAHREAQKITPAELDSFLGKDALDEEDQIRKHLAP